MPLGGWLSPLNFSRYTVLEIFSLLLLRCIGPFSKMECGQSTRSFWMNMAKKKSTAIKPKLKREKGSVFSKNI